MDHQSHEPARFWYYYDFSPLQPGRYYCGDCFQLLPAIESGTVDMVLIDPPYYMGKDKAWDCFEGRADYMAFMGRAFIQAQRILKENGTLGFWHNDLQKITWLCDWLERNTDMRFATWGIWVKPNHRRKIWVNPGPGNTLRSWFNIGEFCVFFVKGTAGTAWNKTGLELAKKRPALLWCSECGRESVAEWISAKSCHGYGLSSGIGIEDDFNNATGGYQDGAEMHCPACGENVTLKSATAMNHGHTDQTFITVPTVCGSYPVFTVFCAERRIYKRSVHYSAVPFEAYVIDGKKVVKLVAYRRGFGGGWYSLGGWQQLSRAVDTMCAPIMYWRTPDLSGTVLENAKLWDYKAQAYESGLFYPLAYSRLYLRHRNVENLITAGLGKLIGSAIEKGAKVSGYYGGRMECPTPNIAWIDWKQAKRRSTSIWKP